MEPISTFLAVSVTGNLVLGVLGNAIWDIKKKGIENFWNRMNLGNHDLQKALGEAYVNTFASLELVLTDKKGISGVFNRIVPQKKYHKELAQDFGDKIIEPFIVSRGLEDKRANFCRAARKSCQVMLSKKDIILNYEELFPDFGRDKILTMNEEARQTFSLIESILFTGEDLSEAPDIKKARQKAGMALLERFRENGTEAEKFFFDNMLDGELFYDFLVYENLFLKGLVYYLDLAIKNNQKVANIIQEYRARDEKIDREKEKAKKEQELESKIGKMEQAIQLMKETGVDISQMKSQLEGFRKERENLGMMLKRIDRWADLQEKMNKDLQTFGGYFGQICSLIRELDGKVDKVLSEVRKLDEGMAEVASEVGKTRDIAEKTGKAVSGVDRKVDFVIDLLQGFRQDGVLSDVLRESLIAGIDPGESFDIHRVYDFKETREYELGRGAVGIVYRARHRGTGEECALKLIKEDYRSNTTVVARFLREGTILKGIKHENIVRVSEVGGGGKNHDFYIHMELLKGKSLRARIDEKSLPGKYNDLLSMTCQLCKGLEVIHKSGIIHRDLNPNNIMVSDDGHVTIMDFGVAKIVGLSGLTMHGEVVGTSTYMSPEQERGESLDIRSDIFSLALVLYEMYTYRKPEIPPKSVRFYNPQLPEWIDTVLGKCLSRDRQARFGSIAKLKRAIEGQGADPHDVEKYRNAMIVFLEDGRISRKEERMIEGLRKELSLPESACLKIEEEARRIVLSESLEEAEEAIKEGDREQACILLNTALRLDPSRKDIRDKLEMLGRKREDQGEPKRHDINFTRGRVISEVEIPSEFNDFREVKKIGKDTGHTAFVNFVAFNDEGYIVSGGQDRKICFWDINTGAEKQRVSLPGNAGAKLIHSRKKGKNIILTANFKDGLILDAGTGETILVLRGHKTNIINFALSGDEKRALTAEADRTVMVWDTETGELINTFKFEANITGCFFSADRKYIVVRGNDKSIRMVDIDIGDEYRCFYADINLSSACLTSDDRFLIGAAGVNVYVWDIAENNLKERFVAGNMGIGSAVVSGDDKLLAMAGNDRNIYLMNMWTWEKTGRLTGHTGYIIDMAFSKDNSRIVSGGNDCSVRAWDIKSKRESWDIRGHTGPVSALSLSPDGTMIASGGSDMTIRLWHLASGKELYMFTGHYSPVLDMAFSADGKYLASVDQNSSVMIWDIAKGEKAISFYAGFGCRSIAFADDDRQIISSVSNGVYKIWDLQSGKPSLSIECVIKTPSLALISSDKKIMMLSAVDKGVNKEYMVEINSGNIIHTFSGNKSITGAMALSDDNRRAASGGTTGLINLWDTESGETIAELRQNRQISSLVFSSDNRYLISGSMDKTINIWDLSRGISIKTLEGHAGIVKGLAVPKDCRFIASCSTDKTIRIWGNK